MKENVTIEPEAVRKESDPKMNAKRDDRLFLTIVILFWFAQYIFVPLLSPHLIALGITASFAGIIMGAYGMAQLVLRIPISVGEDINGKHKVFIITGLAVMVMAALTPLLSSSPIAYFLSRMLSGVAASMWVSFTAAFTQNVPDVKQRMGKLIAANNFGVMLSYIVGGLLYPVVGMKGLFATSALSAFAGLLLITRWQPAKTPASRPFNKEGFLTVIRNRHLWNCALLMALCQMVIFATSSSFVSTYAKLMGASSVMISFIAVAFNATGTLMSWAYAQGVMKKLSERWQLVVAFGVMAVYCALLPLCSAPWHVALVQLVGGISRSLAYTLLMAIAPAQIPPEAKTTATGVFQSVYSLGMTAGPVVMGHLLDASGGSYTFSFLMMSVAALVGVAWALITFQKNAQHD